MPPALTSDRATSRRGAALALLGLVALLVAGGTALAQAPEEPPLYAGRLLADALLELRAQGLQIVFTSTTVTPEMRVGTEPNATRPRELLDQLLAPHGLVSRDGPSGSVVVVRGPAVVPEPAAISGRVATRGEGRPVPGVEIRLVGLETTTSTDLDGAFLLEVPGPGLYSLEVRRRGFVIEHVGNLQVGSVGLGDLVIALDPAPVTEEQVVVTPSRVSLMRQQPAMPLALSRGDMQAMPHLGDDFFRALSLLPGVTGNDVSAEFHVRGGRSDETQVLLDGQELYETYHLKDFDNALSVVATTTLESVDLSTGGFPVEHGDRMSGVLDMTSRRPSGPRRTQIGISVLNLHLGSGGTFAGDRASWLAQGRRGSTELAKELLGPESPRYWDAFGKLDYQLTERQSLRANALYSDDSFNFEDIGVDGVKRRATSYQSSYLWLTHRALLGSSLLVDSAISRSRIDRDRRGFEFEDDVQFDIDDRRELLVVGLRHGWNWRVTPRQHLKWGLERRDFEANYDYDATYNFDIPLAQIRQNASVDSIRFARLFDADHDSLYLADRVLIGERATFELGLRHDRHTLTDESLLSPRLNASFNVASGSVVRASWGRFTQSQRPYELHVEDGESSFHPVERSEHQVLGLEHHFAATAHRLGLALRVELYHREVSNPLPRYENLYEPINNFPEVEPDRVRTAPERSAAEGLELFLRGRQRRFGWWLNYTYSTSEDEIEGRWERRQFDQTHALNLDFDFLLDEHWTLNLAWRYHTGWPTTPLTLVEETVVAIDEETLEEESTVVFVPVLGPRFSDRLPDYHRLDLRLSRRWQLQRAAMTFFVDVQNALDRRNVSGFDFEIDEEAGVLIANHEEWAQILPSFGLSVEF